MPCRQRGFVGCGTNPANREVSPGSIATAHDDIEFAHGTFLVGGV